MTEDMCWMSAAELAAAIKSRKLSPVEIIRKTLERIEAINPSINAFVTVTADSALAEARAAEKAVMEGRVAGPLHGVPFSVKDVVFTAGVRTTMGSELMKDFVPPEDAVHIARLKKAGAILLGKTNTPEFAAKGVTENVLFGVTRNPWDLTKTTGGSSGGAAAAVAAGLGPLAAGNDAGGSIRSPSSCCGVVGLKPQFGRIPAYPVWHLWETLNHEGPITRTVEDAALMLDAMAGPHWGDRHSLPLPAASFVQAMKGGVRGLNAAWSAGLGYATVAAEVRAICEAAVKTLAGTGIIVEEATPGFQNPESAYAAISNCDLAAMLSTLGQVDELKGKVNKFLRARVSMGQKLTGVDYLRATFTRREIAASLGKFFEGYDLLFTPTLGVPAWPVDLPGIYPAEVDGKPVSNLGWILAFPFNLTGQPAMSIPAGWTAGGLPVGLQIVGRMGDEATVLRAGRALEEANPWAHRKPPL